MILVISGRSKIEQALISELSDGGEAVRALVRDPGPRGPLPEGPLVAGRLRHLGQQLLERPA